MNLDEVIRIEGGQVLATLIRLTGDIDAAEDALQDAVVVAAETWRRDGIPDRPGAWLTTVARNKALDRIRREARRSGKEAEAGRLLIDDDPGPVGDDILRLLFTCCHPALARESQVALALRTLCGLTTGEIARVFLVPDATAGQRISRAKAKIAKAHIPYRVPESHELPERLPAVLSCIYLVFTTGHDAPVGELTARVDLCTEAIRIGRLLHDLMPDEGSVTGLLALMLATDARRASRVDGAGELVLMADQDRSGWDTDAIAEAAAMVDSVLRRGRPGPFQIQAAIACLHGLAPTFADTDWPQIAQLYELLESHQPTSVVRLNRAVALAHAVSPEAGLALLEGLDEPSLNRWHVYWSTRGELERRAGDVDAAAASLRTALDCAPNDTERRFLERALEAIGTRG
jgi:RNA polymerase sigma-70 factor (ECF subfamily)